MADYDGSFVYGCGKTMDCNSSNFYDSISSDGTTKVGMFGTYGYGMCDITGNVSEWTSSLYDPNSSKGYRVIRGGNWDLFAYDTLDIFPPFFCSTSYRRNMNPKFTFENIGFRACKDLIVNIPKVSGMKRNNNNDYWSDFEDADKVAGYCGLRGIDAIILKSAVWSYNVSIAQGRMDIVIKTYDKQVRQGKSDEELKYYVKDAKKWQEIHAHMVDGYAKTINEFRVKPKDNPKQYNKAAQRVINDKKIPQKYRNKIILLEESDAEEELLVSTDVSRNYGLSGLNAMILEGAVSYYNSEYSFKMFNTAKNNFAMALEQKNITEARLRHSRIFDLLVQAYPA